jgi:hypothetical protein
VDIPATVSTATNSAGGHSRDRFNGDEQRWWTFHETVHVDGLAGGTA